MAHDTYTHAEDGRVCILLEDGTWFVPLDAGGEGYACERRHGGLYHSLVRAGSAATCICGEWEPKLGELVLRSFDEHLRSARNRHPRPWRDPVEWALSIQAEHERAEREDDEFRLENVDRPTGGTPPTQP